MLADLALYKFRGLLYHIENPALEDYIFNDVHFSANFCFCAIIADEAYSCTREESLRIFSEEQDCGTDDLFSTIARDDKILIAAQIIQRRSSIADFLCVGGYKIEVDIINGGVWNRGVLKETSTLGIQKLKSLVEAELLGFVPNTQIYLICLICMNLRTWKYMHDKYMVGLSFSVCTVYYLGINTDRGNTIVQWSAEQFIDSLVLTINAGYGAVIFDANGSVTTVCISKSDNEIGQSFRVNSCAFTVKKLRFSMEAQFFYVFVSIMLSLPFSIYFLLIGECYSLYLPPVF